MQATTFYYRKTSLVAKIFLSLAFLVLSPSLLSFIIYIQDIDIDSTGVLGLSLVLWGMGTFIVFTSPSESKTRFDFACTISSKSITFPSSVSLFWQNISDIKYIVEEKIIETEDGKVKIYHYFMDVYKSTSISPYRVSLDAIKYYQPKEVFDEVYDAWLLWQNKGISSRNIEIPRTIHYETVKKGLEGFYYNLLILVLILIFILIFYFYDQQDQPSISTAITISIFLLMGIMSYLVPLLTRMDSIALNFIPQGIQNEGLMDSRKVILWSNIESIRIKRTQFGGYIAVDLKNEQAYLNAISFRRRITARIYKLIGLSYFCIRNDVKECSLINVHRALVNEWRKYSLQKN